MQRDHDGQERALQDRHRLHDRSVAPDGSHPLEVRGAEGQPLRLPAVRPPRPDAQRQRRRRQRHHRQRRRRRRAGQRRRPHAARRLGHRHEDQRRQPRLRDPGVLGARRQPRLRPGDQRLRRPAQRRPRPTRHGPHALLAARQRRARQRRADGARAPRPRRALHARARLRRHAGQRGVREPAVAAARLRRRAEGLRARLARLRRQARRAQAAQRRLVAALARHPRRVLPQRQLREGHRGQDLPWRGRRLADLAVGSGGLGRRPEEHLLRLLPRGLRARPLRGVDGGLPRRRSAHGQGHDALPLRAPAAAGRLDAAQQPAQRQARARQLQHPARRVRLPADHGAGRRAHRQRLLQGPHRAGRQLRGQPRAVVRA